VRNADPRQRGDGNEAQRTQHAFGQGPDVKKGATTAHVKIELPGGAVITASITNEAVDELALKVGDEAFALIKASDVIVGKK
jgi:molybdopterin-binding protein